MGYPKGVAVTMPRQGAECSRRDRWLPAAAPLSADGLPPGRGGRRRARDPEGAG
ncbi:hypothetical protein [Streptomyces colonosanans]|uniref:hypothetical protein n=1 Tax=Streptomyces colonosanans TaxID=1428652 RepID=UPI0015A5CFD4|nr:hypothetical protein [Streptomyces colonosanans]